MRNAHDAPGGVGLLCGVLVVGLFSSFTLASRLGFSSALTVPDLAALRVGIAGTVLLPILLRHGFSGATWTQAVALSLLGGIGFALLALAGFRLAPATHGAVLLHGTLPLFTFAILATTAKQVPPADRSAGIALIAIGVGLMAWDSLAGASTSQLLGDLCLLLASACWSSYAIYVRRLGLAPIRAAAIVAGLSMASFLPIYALLAGKAMLLASAADLLLQALFQGVLIGAGSIFVYTQAVAALGPARTSLFTAAVPCLTTLAAMPLLSEQPTRLSAMGVVVVSAGMVVALRPAPAAGSESPALLRVLRTWAARGQDRRRLAAMSEQDLADLGIPKQLATQELNRPFWQDWSEGWKRWRE